MIEAPIGDIARLNFFTDSFAQLVFFWPMYGPLVIVIPFIFFNWPRRFWGLAFSFAVLLVLGLGGTTPLPRLFFGENWQWLTYDRFAFWASLTLLPFFGSLFILVQRRWRHRIAPGRLSHGRRGTLIAVFTFSVFAASSLGSWFAPMLFMYQPARLNLQPIVDFLNQDDRSQWRYLTFGFGSQFAYLNLLTTATTIDGSYHTARALPVLRESGIGEIDTVFWTDKGVAAIDPILKESGQYGVRWGFVNRKEYIPELEENGWLYRWTLSNGVEVWEN